MTVYARSDVMSVALSTSHGGCGATHTRPVTHGAPAAAWALSCPACENHLRHDPLWATMPADVPETPDEERVREDRDKKGTLDRDKLLADAIIGMAGQHKDLPAQLAEALLALTGRLTTAGGDSLACSAGHANRPDSRFCVECGVALVTPAAEPLPADQAAALDSVVEAEPATTAPAYQGHTAAELTQLTARELRELCRLCGLDEGGSKAQLVSRLAERS